MAEDDYLGNAAKGAAGGASAGPWGAVGGAAVGLLSPFIAKGLGSLFGLDEPSAEEKAAMGQLRSVALGAQTPAQLMLAEQRAKTQQQLASMAARGTAQQQAGQTRMAMQMAPEIQQQQAAQLAAMRSQEQRHAQEALAQLQASVGSRTRQYERGLVGAGLQGGMAMAANAMLGGGGGGGGGTSAADEALKKQLGIGAEATPTSADYAKELGFTPGAAAPAAAPAAAAQAATPAAAAMTPQQASNLQTAVQQKQASPWESLYSGPAMPKAAPSAQQEADSEMYYRGMTGGKEGRDAAASYFANTNMPTSTVPVPEGGRETIPYQRYRTEAFNRGNIERSSGLTLGAKPAGIEPQSVGPSELSDLQSSIDARKMTLGGNMGQQIPGIPMRKKLGFGYGY